MKNSNNLMPYLLVMPGFLLAALVVLWPVVQLTEISMSEVNRFGQIKGFGGFANYVSVLSDPDFLSALWRTVIWVIGIVVGSVAISLPLAIILHQDFYGRSIARVIVMLPWAVSITMTAIVWRWALNGESGMLNSGLRSMGLIDHNIQWLAQASTAFPMQILIGITVTVPFTVTILLGGLASVGDDIYEAARLEGASALQTFRRITVPLMKPFLNIALVLNTIYVFNSFPIIWATTQGGPANSTDILVTYLYKLGFRYGRLGDASALSLMMFLLLLVLLIFYVRLVSRGEKKS